MSQPKLVITGPHGSTPPGIQALAPNRLDIRDLVKNENVKQFSLYIQAIEIMFCTEQENLISWFQIGGIHGLPHVQWNASGTDKSVSEAWGGYCTHGSVLFPTWHRPYTALFEQVLQQHAIGIAEQYPTDCDAWNSAAMTLRAPFWDWASQSLLPPEVISCETVEIITPASGGKKVFVDNPLMKYKFHPIDPSFPASAKIWPATLRYPTSPGKDATSNVKRLERALVKAGPGLRSGIYNLMARVSDWEAFSNHTPGDGGNATTSLEGIHDSVHILVGGQSGSGTTAYEGHMSDPAIAGFDPIFFMHHCNVDRMLSLWAAIHPEVWVTEGPANDGTWTITETSTVGDDTGLSPFWNSQEGYWKSTELKKTSDLGWTYPEFNGLDMNNKELVRRVISKKVNELYGGIVPVREWSAQIHFKKFQLRKSFSVLIFIGKVPENPADWETSTSLVGATYAFVNSAADMCANCRSHSDMVVEGFVGLNDVLLKTVGSLDPEIVVPYLQNKSSQLSWRIYTGVEVPLDELPSLEIIVKATPLSQRSGDMFPTAGTPVSYPEITRGRRGGCI
ncbi:tyrosinase [Amylocystis lapponica]|nr:tyrosinase [Amylocystis lapponica]